MKINQEISLETELPIRSVQDFFMCWEINEHADLKLDGILEHDSWDSVRKQDFISTEFAVTLNHIMEQNEPVVLFRGLIQDIRLFWNHGVAMVHVIAISGSVKLDAKNQRVCRSFQNPVLNYSDVARQIVKMGNGSVICTTGKNEIQRPYICYQETIWEFLKRLASCQGSCIMPDIKTGRPNLWFGLRTGEQIKTNLSDCKTSLNIQKRYGNNEKGSIKKTYCMECRESYSLGDWMIERGEKFVICAKKAQLSKGELIFIYQLVSEKNISNETYCNDAFTGLSLQGVVEEADHETIRLRFDMDGETGVWSYPWRPETGNGLYAMPEIGAKAAIFFMNHDESSGIAVRCIGLPSDKRKAEDKSLAAPKGGKIELFTGSLNMQKKEEKMGLDDSGSINFSGGRIEFKAYGKVKLKAAQIALSAASEIKAATE